MKVAAVQIKPRLGNVTANRKKIRDFAMRAGEKGSDLMVFPELCTSGYNLKKGEVRKTAEPIPGKTTRMVTTLAKKYSSTIVFGLNERDGKNFYNSAVIVGPEGLKGRYRKIHLFNKEKDLFEPGERLKVIQTEHARVGLMICFDWFFPEMVRALTLKGADIIAHPANFVPPHPPQGMAIRALENRVFTITANRIGEERGLQFTGASKINTPTGETVMKASKDEEEIITAEIDVHQAKDKQITERNHLLKDIQQELLVDLVEIYQEWLGKKS